MATVNTRLKRIRSVTINGVSAGGAMTVNLQYGYENIMYSSPDGLAVPVKDKETQFVRGTGMTQDWTQIIDLLTGTLGTLVFYQRKSGVAEATGFVKHTITAPVIHTARFSITKGGYGTCIFSFECRAADETKGITDMWVPLDGQASPSHITAARGGYRILSTVHGGTLTIYHVMGLNFEIAMPMDKACNDNDVGYTCVDAELDGMRCGGSLIFQDGTIADSTLLCQKLVTAAAGNLVLTARQGSGATSKVITIANADFSTGGGAADAASPFSDNSLDFDVNNDPATPLTLAGDNKIITIENAV